MMTLPDREPQTVLVVDDDASIVAVIADALADEGYRVLTAAGAEEALRLACAEQPALLLLDLLMPGMNGVEVARRLRAQAWTAAIPLIAMTAAQDPDAALADLVVDDRLPKPFDLADLYAVVARWVSRGGASSVPRPTEEATR